MGQDIKELFQISRQYLVEIFKKTNQFRDKYPEMLNDSELIESFNLFEKEYHESCEKFDKPTLSIATLGTTSAGKSTIVNALIGRRIAPIEADEMSGGLLKIEHGLPSSLTVEKTEGAKWKTGTWDNLNDEKIHDEIKELMSVYHTVRKETREHLAAPDVLVKGLLLPHVDKKLLGLSDIFEVEFIDLPGLKSVKDETNLEIIQSRISKSFCLVALDCLQTDNLNRAKLLKELKDVVEYLGGKTDSMIFLLNRVDALGLDDKSVEKRIQILKKEIRDALNLSEYPEILPFSAKLLYYAQCAWGAAPLDGNPSAPKKTQASLIRALSKECAPILEEKYEADRKKYGDDSVLEDWFYGIKKSLRNDDSSLEVEDLRRILIYALDWSGGSQLWKLLKERLTTFFPEIVLLPMLFKLIQTHENLSKELQSVVETRKVNSVKKAEEELEKINNIAINIIAKVEKDGKLFINNLDNAVNKLQQPDWKEAVGSLKNLGDGFANLDETISTIELDLIKDIIQPITSFLEDFSKSRDELEVIMSRVVNETIAGEVARSYEEYSRKILLLQRKYNFEEKSDMWELKVSTSDPDVEEVFESLERVTKQLFDSIRDALQARANFLIQAKASEIGKSVNSILEAQKDGYRSFCDNLGSSFGFTNTVFSKLQTSISGGTLKLPDNLLRFPRYPQVQDTVDTQTRTETRNVIEKKRRWFVLWLRKVDTEVEKSKTVVDKYYYKTLQLPNSRALAAEWEEGIYDAEAEMWAALSKWIKGILNNLSASFAGAVESTQRLIERSLNEQITMIRTKRIQTEQRLRSIEADLLDIAKTRAKLKETTRSN